MENKTNKRTLDFSIFQNIIMKKNIEYSTEREFQSFVQSAQKEKIKQFIEKEKIRPYKLMLFDNNGFFHIQLKPSMQGNTKLIKHLKDNQWTYKPSTKTYFTCKNASELKKDLSEIDKNFALKEKKLQQKQIKDETHTR